MSFRMNAIVLRVVENRLGVGEIKEIEGGVDGEIRKIKVTKIYDVWLASDGTLLIAEINFKDVIEKKPIPADID
jgi:hypothetical protein|nr:MAG TPA: hypothetical protein [Caudoviricetes sp.]DAR56665.1 MAG TPA: hypothetical protein [Bacteriophage sp.]